MRFLLPILALAACTPAPPRVISLRGHMTWKVAFGAAGQAAGLSDCSYTRDYAGVEDDSLPWLCPRCELTWRVRSTLTDGAECYASIASGTPSPIEWLGYAADGFHRANSENWPLTNQGTVTQVAGGFTTHHVVDSHNPDGYAFTFDIAGTYSEGIATTDPLHGYEPPRHYACGWPHAAPGAYAGDYTLRVDGPLPDAVLTDRCGEPVRLWDLLDGYLVLDVAAMDCGPCQQMASGERAFADDMKAQGIPVRVVTLLAPSLNDPLTSATTDDLQQWVQRFGLRQPVLSDRGYGLWVVGDRNAHGFEFPTSVLVAPDGTVIDRHVGFGGWSEVEQAILADAGRR